MYLDTEGSHQGDDIGQAVLLVAQSEHPGIAWSHRELGHSVTHGRDTAQ